MARNLIWYYELISIGVPRYIRQLGVLQAPRIGGNGVTDRLIADYELESPLSLGKAAAVIAGEQSSGTFVKLPGETAGLVAASGARVENIEETGVSSTPSLPCR